ncbi:MAG: 30S ribosomal protein S12 methylthiotransferase RimO [Oscillospiraceae bacterium]|nr:30S ribosomal protein S12 methylthiotransferase RimO [Oscillospiraceae bacterium]
MGKVIGMISLGCPKNQVDAELMLAKLTEAGYEISGQICGCDAVIVNTCGFIDDAKREAIDNILEMAEYKDAGEIGKIIVTGCLAERFTEEIKAELPEVDAIVGIGCNADIVKIVDEALNSNERIVSVADKENLPLAGSRVLTTPEYWAYLKIADGCSNCCTYCAIPKIRGPFRSRPMESIISEAKDLVSNGVKELILIAQDTTKYGEDIYGELKLSELLHELCKIENLEWIRLLYCYPDRLTDELIDTIASEEKICNYIDLPLQHASGKVLKDMNRHGDRETLTTLINKIRNKIPDVCIRTTFITGFPGETPEDFTELSEFVKEIKFDRLGCFTYSPEEGTPAASFENQVEQDEKVHRGELIMDSQYDIVIDNNQKLVGKTLKVVVDEYDPYTDVYKGRTYKDAPEIDGHVTFVCDKGLTPGTFTEVTITNVDEYDLIGECKEK